MSERYGMMGEFSSAEAIVSAAQALHAQGHRLEAYTPFSVDGLPEALGYRNNAVPLLTLLGGIIGGVGGYFLQWYSAVIDYPINSGGRPLNAWPAFIPATFEMTILGAALAGFIGFLLLNGLPRLRHPVFAAADFDLASRDRFFLCVRDADDERAVGDSLRALGAKRVCEVSA